MPKYSRVVADISYTLINGIETCLYYTIYAEIFFFSCKSCRYSLLNIKDLRTYKRSCLKALKEQSPVSVSNAFEKLKRGQPPGKSARIYATVRSYFFFVKECVYMQHFLQRKVVRVCAFIFLKPCVEQELSHESFGNNRPREMNTPMKTLVQKPAYTTLQGKENICIQAFSSIFLCLKGNDP